MNKEFIAIRGAIENIINSTLMSDLNRKIDEQIYFIKKVREVLNTCISDIGNLTGNELEFYKRIECYNENLLSLLKENFAERKIPDVEEDLSEFFQKYSNYSEQIDIKRIEDQDDDRFRIIAGNTIIVKVVKLIKGFTFFVTTLPQRFLNLIRKIFRRPPKALRKWKRIIFFRNLLRISVRDALLIKSFDLMSQVYKDIALSYQKLWLSEEKINKHFTAEFRLHCTDKYLPDKEEISRYELDFDSVLVKLGEYKDEILKKTGEYLDEIFVELENIYQLAGTFEYPARYYSAGRLEKSENNAKEKYEKIIRGWDNTLFALFDDWRLNKDIYTNEILEVQELYALNVLITGKITQRIVPGMEEIKEELESCKKRIEEQSGFPGIRDILTGEKTALSAVLDGRLIIDTAELLVIEGIPETIDQLETNIRKNIDRTAVKRAIVKTQNYDREIRESEIEFIEPLELIRFEILPDFLRDTRKLKAKLTSQIDQIQKGLLNIGQIADFNLESAIALTEFSADEKQSVNDPGSVASAGLQRAVAKTEEIISGLFAVQETIINSASLYVGTLNEQTLKLTQTDNIFEIRLRIAKARAIEKSAEYRKKTIETLKHLIPRLISNVKQVFINAGNLYKNLRLRLGLEKRKKGIATEISDFLAESENAINKLPYVYQRLFRIEPLEEEKFYEPRTREVDAVQLAFNNWKLGRYAPVVLIGEKGSGLTTIVNFLVKGVVSGTEITRIDVVKATEHDDYLLKLFGGALKKVFTDYTEIIRHLNSLSVKRCIIIENIHHLFIRKIGGFTTLKFLFEIISATNQSVFWIVTSNLYGWNYLERVLTIGDYFSYSVKLAPLTDTQIVDIILKRHRVSGFNINFEPSPDDQLNKSFQKSDDEEKQKYLMDKYFSELNGFARSNLSISLFFWMRSTREVVNDVITIGSLEGLDFSFLQDLSDEKIFTLNALLIHDGLTVEQHSLVFHQSVYKSRLILLLLADDGIITKSKNGYIINPLLYRQTVSLLQSKNILD